MRRRLLDHTYKKTVTGNPAVAKSVARRNPDISFPGKTEQVSYEGNNLFDISKIIPSNLVSIENENIINVEILATSNGSTAKAPNSLKDYCPNMQIGKTYTINFESNGTEKRIYLIGANIYWNVGSSKQVTSAILESKVYFYASGIGTRAEIRNFMVNEGTTVLPYEPYTGGKPSPSPEYKQDIVNTQSPVQIEISDGGENIQTVTITSGRPITQWDKLTKKGDVWVWMYQTAYIESYNGEEITGEWQSTTGELSTGASVQYKTSPEFVPLSDEEQQLMNALHTNNPTTVIQNSIGTDVTLTYKTKRSLEVTQ